MCYSFEKVRQGQALANKLFNAARYVLGNVVASTDPEPRPTTIQDRWILSRLQEAKAQFETNFFGIVRMVNAVLPGMRAAGAGKIINISSLAGNTAIPYSGFYSATKFAVEGYSESLWYEVRPFGVSVSLVEPGFVNTPIVEASPAAARPLPAYDATRKRMLAAFGHALEGGIPPEQVARRVLQIIEQPNPGLRYRVGAQATWLPRLRNVVPWKVYAAGVRKTFAV